MALCIALLQADCSTSSSSDDTRTGTLQVSAATTGSDLDPDGYMVTVDGDSAKSLGIKGTVTYSGLSAGDHSVTLAGVASNCSISGSNSVTIPLADSGTASADFDVRCTSTRGGTATISGVSWDCQSLVTGAKGSDLWPITWSDDGRQYAAWGDGDGFSGPTYVSYGVARILGSAGSHTTSDLAEGPAASGQGKVESLISVRGVLYFLFNSQSGSPRTHQLWTSTDHGASMAQVPRWSFPKSGAPLMVPTEFVQFGQDDAAATDSFVYATAGDWGTATTVYLMRAPVDSLKTDTSWEVWSRSAWTTNLADRSPIYNDASATSGNGATHAVITYLPPLSLYVMTFHPADDMGSFTILYSQAVTGPWTKIAGYSNWCGWSGQSTTETLPRYIAPQWISADGTSFWLVFSGTGTWDRFNTLKGSFQLP